MDATGSLMTPPQSVLHVSALVLAIATATILAALAFEHIGGYAPCPLCLEERYAYYFAVPASAAAVFAARGNATLLARILLALIAFAFIANMAAGIYHAGVEWKWWPGPGECSGGFELKWGESGVAETPVIRCDEASFRFLGLSFAGWNAIVSAVLASLAAYGAAQRH
jgi:disulfide bond formation protein DsbB